MTDEELAAIEARANAATAGPWTFDAEDPGIVGPDGKDVAARWTQSHFDDDCSFIDHAREDIPRLVAEVKRLRALARGET